MNDMNDILVINTLKDFLDNYKKNIKSRYEEDSKFKEFKSFLIWKRYLLVFFNIILLISGIILSIKFLIFIKINIVNIKIIFLFLNSIYLIFGVGLIIFSVFNLIEICKTYKYLKLISSIKEIKNFKWNKWQFIDFIFKKPFKLNKKNIYIYIGKTSHYCINLLLQYPTGHFAWFGINNWKTVTGKNKSISKNGDEKTFKDDELRKKDYLKIKTEFIIKNMKNKSYNDLIPSTIAGIRIRANTEENPIKITKIELEN